MLKGREGRFLSQLGQKDGGPFYNMSQKQSSALGRFIDEVEETLIAVILALMTLITFANVIARYVFNDNILWALEMTVFLFAWLVLLGASYGVKKSVHIGVDVIVAAVNPRLRKILTLISVTACIAFAVLLLIGSWQYWYPFVTKRAFLETNDVPMPEFLQFFATWLNEGEQYEKLPRFIPYFVLPVSAALLTLRYFQVAWEIMTDKRELIISSHEVEDQIEEISHKDK